MNTVVTKKWGKRKFNKKVAITLAVIGVIAAGLGVNSYKKTQKAKITPVTLAKVQKKTLTESVSVTGNIEPANKSEMNLNQTLLVKEVLVTEGQNVKKGDVLLKYDINDYTYQLKKAQLGLNANNDSINKTLSAAERNDKTNLESTEKAAQMAVDTAKSNLEDANKKLKQNEELLKGGYISQNDYDTSKKNAADLEAQLKSSQLKLADAQNALNNFAANTQDKLNDLLKQNESNKLEIENMNNKIKDAVVTSNIDGTVVKCDVKADENPKNGASIIINDMSKLIISADINQFDAVKLKVNQKADIKIKGLNKKYTGTISKLGLFAQKTTAANSQENKVNVKISIDNPDESIKTGYEGDADIILNQKQDVLVVNYDAIKQSGSEKYVFVAENGTAKKKVIKTGLETEMYVEVLEGLKEGDEIIANPSKTLKEGDKVAAAGIGVKKK